MFLGGSRDFSGLLYTTVCLLMSKSCLNHFIYGSYQIKRYKSILDIRIMGSRAGNGPLVSQPMLSVGSALDSDQVLRALPHQLSAPFRA